MLITQSEARFVKRDSIVHLDDYCIDLKSPIVAGIINVTPDSFYDGGWIKNEKSLLKRVETMIEDGATIIDIGAISTRPGSESISTKEELNRLLPAVNAVRKAFPEQILSLDTFRSWVAVRVIDEVGPVIINDISGGTMDSKMFDTVGRLKVPYILSHIKGTPVNMQQNPEYKDIIQEISTFFSQNVKKLTKAGVTDIILDPGFGFGKNLAHNFELLNRLDSFKVFQLPLMVGVSRKSMIHKTLNIKPDEALNGTSVVNTLALLGGADILRVHDVKEAMEVISIFEELKLTAE